MRKLLSFTLAVILVVTVSSSGYATTTQVDSLIEKLVDKGILTKSEGIELKGEIAADEKILREEGFKQSLPSWVRDMKLKGDLRMRYQSERRDSTNSRNRGRIRLRLGVETKVNEKVNVGFGLATGGNSSNAGDPRSTNQTLDNSFEKPDLRIDYAYAEYKPAGWAKITGGKMLSPFWVPKDLLFDSDISFDGVSSTFSGKFMSGKLEPFFTTGFFILDENSTENYDPYMYVIQPGFKLKTTQNTSLKLAGTYYGFDTIKNYNRLNWSSNTNTVNSSTRYVYDYDSMGVGSEFSIANPIESLKDWGVDQLTFLGEYIHNPNADEHDSGFLLGAKLGAHKVAGPKQWQLAYNWRRLERNAFLDIFPDSDFYGGGTHVQGQEVEFTYGLGKNVSVGVDYYRSVPIGGEEIDTRQARVENLIQADLNLKF